MSTNTWLVTYGMLSTYCLAGCLMEHFAVFSGWTAVGPDQLPTVQATQGAGSGIVYVVPKTLLTGFVVTLLITAPSGLVTWPVWAGLGALAVSWLSSALIQVPTQLRLRRTADRAAAIHLQRTDWIRVVTMVAHCGFAIVTIALSLTT